MDSAVIRRAGRRRRSFIFHHISCIETVNGWRLKMCFFYSNPYGENSRWPRIIYHYDYCRRWLHSEWRASCCPYWAGLFSALQNVSALIVTSYLLIVTIHVYTFLFGVPDGRLRRLPGRGRVECRVRVGYFWNERKREANGSCVNKRFVTLLL